MLAISSYMYVDTYTHGSCVLFCHRNYRKSVCLVTTFLLQDEGVLLVKGYMYFSIQNRKYANAYELM